MKVYKHLRELRLAKGLSQEQLGALIHVSQNTYSQYETGKLKITADVLFALATLYHTSVDYLLDRTDDPTPYTPLKKRRI